MMDPCYDTEDVDEWNMRPMFSSTNMMKCLPYKLMADEDEDSSLENGLWGVECYSTYILRGQDPYNYPEDWEPTGIWCTEPISGCANGAASACEDWGGVNSVYIVHAAYDAGGGVMGFEIECRFTCGDWPTIEFWFEACNTGPPNPTNPGCNAHSDYWPACLFIGCTPSELDCLPTCADYPECGCSCDELCCFSGCGNYTYCGPTHGYVCGTCPL
jgi:hypothetical protein